MTLPKLYIPKGLDNMLGPIGPDVRKRLSQVYRDPKRYWDRDHGIILRDKEPGTLGLTLWLAILRIDPTFPRTGRVTDRRGRTVEDWKRYPTPELIQRALLYAWPEQGRVF